MALDYLDTPEQRRRKGQQAQASSNSSASMRLVQGYTQPAGGHMPTQAPAATQWWNQARRPNPGDWRGVPRMPGQGDGPAPPPQATPVVMPPPTGAEPRPDGYQLYGSPMPGPSRRLMGAGAGATTSAAPPSADPWAAFRRPATSAAPPPTTATQTASGAAGAATGAIDPAAGAAVRGAAQAAATGEPSFNANWDTDGYPAPKYTVAGSATAPAGWDPQKWTNPNHQTPKYAIGRILSQYSPTVNGLGQAMAEIARAYPGAMRIGDDKVDIPGLGVIDVLQGAANGGVAWTWIDQSQEQPPSTPLPGEPPMEPTPPMAGEGGGAGGGDGDRPRGDGDEARGPAAANPGSAAMDQAYAALLRALGFAVPDAAGLKEASKENLLAERDAQRNQFQQQAQARGMSRSLTPELFDQVLNEQMAGNLTRSYRDIDTTTQQQGFNNLSSIGGALQGLGSAQHGQWMDERRLEQDAQQFAAQMGFNYAQLSQQDRQFFQQLALNRWIAEQNASARQMELLLGGL